MAHRRTGEISGDEGPVVLPAPVPPAALCDAPAAVLEAALDGTGALWWHGGAHGGSAEGFASWPPRLGRTEAVQTDPNDGNARAARRGPETGLQCRTGVHCGFVAPDVTPDAAEATLAVRWATSGEDGRTLLTLNTGGAARKSEDENYLFLSQADGVLTAKDDAGRVEASLPCRGRGPHLAVASLAIDRLALFLDGEETSALAAAPVLAGAASLFVAARNQRPKLRKTLGSALILDVWFWPAHALLDGPRGRARLTALRRYHLWAGG